MMFTKIIVQSEAAPKKKKASTANVSRNFDPLVTTLDALPLAG